MLHNFLSTSDFGREALESILTSAFEFKNKERVDRPLDRKSIALVFFNPSLRTRASMQVGVFEMGGNVVMLEPGGTSWTLEHREGVVMDEDKTEHLKEFVEVLARYVSAIGVRTFAELKDWNAERRDPILSAFARYSSVPIINLESAMHHPCQSLADIMTIRERFGRAKKRILLTWAWHPKPLPMAVPNSFALAAAQFGHDLVISHPAEYELDDDLVSAIDRQAAKNGGSVEFTSDPITAFDDVDVVYAKSWGGRRFYGNASKDIEHRAGLRNSWIVDEIKMSRTNDAAFMHCLPVRRNVIVTDAVIDSQNAIVIDQAENRLHVQKAILAKLVK